MLGAALLALAVTGLELLKPWPITWVIDYLVGSSDLSTVSIEPVIGFAALAFAVPALMGIAEERLQIVVARVSRKATVRIRSDVFEHIHRLEFSEHQRQFSGDLLIRLMGDVNMIRDLLFPSWLTLLSRRFGPDRRNGRVCARRLAAPQRRAPPTPDVDVERQTHLVEGQGRRWQTTQEGRCDCFAGSRVDSSGRDGQGLLGRNANRR